jgi:hypothetical protein
MHASQLPLQITLAMQALSGLQQLVSRQRSQGVSPAWGVQEPPELVLDAADVVNPELDEADVLNPELDAADVVSPELDATDVVSPELDATDVVSPELDAAVVVSPELDAAVVVPLHGPAQEAATQTPRVVVMVSAAGHCCEQNTPSPGWSA